MSNNAIEQAMRVHSRANLEADRESRVQEITQALQRLPTPLLDAIAVVAEQVERSVLTAADPDPQKRGTQSPEEEHECVELWGQGS